MGNLKNQLVSISELNELIGFATRTTTLDASGAQVESFDTPTANIRAKVRYMSVNEAEGALKQEKLTTEIKVWVRYSSSYTAYKYIYWGAKYYDIIGIEHTPRSRYHVIKARLIEA
jgi:SPP1 family predicted phage head-tail adaptor